MNSYLILVNFLHVMSDMCNFGSLADLETIQSVQDMGWKSSPSIKVIPENASSSSTCLLSYGQLDALRNEVCKLVDGMESWNTTDKHSETTTCVPDNTSGATISDSISYNCTKEMESLAYLVSEVMMLQPSVLFQAAMRNSSSGQSWCKVIKQLHSEHNGSLFNCSLAPSNQSVVQPCKTTKLAELEETNLDLIYKLTVSYIQLGKDYEAWTYFTRLESDAEIPKIIQDAYSTTMTNLVNFSMMLTQRQRSSFYVALYEKMKAYGDLITHNILLFHDAVMKQVEQLCGNTPIGSCEFVSDDFKEVVGKVNESLDSFTASCSYQVKSNIFQGLVELVSPKTANSDSWEGWLFARIVPNLIRGAAYENIPNVLKFIRALRWNIHKYLSYKILIEESLITDNMEYLALAINMKLSEEDQNGPDPSLNYSTLKQSIPTLFRMLVWHNQCFLQNTHYNYEYLYAGHDKYDKASRNVRCWIPGVAGREMPFEFIPVATSSEVQYQFKIRNVFWDEYLGAQPQLENSDNDRGLVMTSLGGCQDTVHNWKLEISNVSSRVIRLKHIGKNNANLYCSAALLDPERRKAYLWLPGTAQKEASWKITCE